MKIMTSSAYDRALVLMVGKIVVVCVWGFSCMEYPLRRGDWCIAKVTGRIPMRNRREARGSP